MTVFRLAWFPILKQMEKALGDDLLTTLYMSFNGPRVGRRAGRLIKGELDMTDLRLALTGDGKHYREYFETPEGKEYLPAILVSFPYLPAFLKEKHKYHYRSWALDSGGFSMQQDLGVSIDIDEYAETCLDLFKNDPTLVEVFTLDELNDIDKTLKNTERLWSAGVPAIPVYHAGEPKDYLQHLKKVFPGKIALGGVAKEKGKKKMLWAQDFFAEVWPMRVHGLGFGAEEPLMALPFHSVDTSSWEAGPCRFGNWRAFKAQGASMSIRGSDQDLRAEVLWYLKLERKAQSRWRKELQRLEANSAPWPLRTMRKKPRRKR